MQPKIDVCVATYKRPELLKKLLLSLRAQETRGEFSFTIIVADNDAQRSAEAIVKDFNATGQKIIYGVAPEQNISLARNKSLSLAAGDYIATIDDDEYANPQWLLQLYKTIVDYQADVVFGSVVPVFHAKTPEYIRKSGAFDLPNPPTGSTENYVFTTANALYRRKLIEGVATPFDPQFGRTGGGDSAFFESLRKQGTKQVWCREARVFAFVPPERTNWRWILQRQFRIGNGYYRIFDRGHVDPQLPRGTKILDLGRRAVKLCYPIPLYVFGSLFDVQYAVKAMERLRTCAFYAGIIAYFLGFQYKEYRGR